MKRTKSTIHLHISEDALLGLRGRQSVRTTFRLSERCINALSILAGQMGIKQKSLFDHLVDDVQSLQSIAREFENFPPTEQRVPKTYVISRRTLEVLETISSRYNTPRDALVEFSIQRVIPLIEEEKKKHIKRQKILKTLENNLRHSGELLNEALRELGEDDPVVQELFAMVRNSETAYRRIRAYVEKGKKIEDFA